jgi:hypothetical protein
VVKAHGHIVQEGEQVAALRIRSVEGDNCFQAEVDNPVKGDIALVGREVVNLRKAAYRLRVAEVGHCSVRAGKKGIEKVVVYRIDLRCCRIPLLRRVEVHHTRVMGPETGIVTWAVADGHKVLIGFVVHGPDDALVHCFLEIRSHSRCHCRYHWNEMVHCF